MNDIKIVENCFIFNYYAERVGTTMTLMGSASEKFHGFSCEVSICPYGKGDSEIHTGIGFLDHMLELFAKHGSFDLKILCDEDLKIDEHHTVDEVSMNLGLAFKRACQSLKGSIKRFGFYILPMDEVMTTSSVDVLAHRQSFVFDVDFHTENIGMLKTEMIRDFWNMFSQKAECNMIIKSEYGINDHHIAEGVFKCVARSIKDALEFKEVL